MKIINFFINFIKKYWKSFYLIFLGIFWISYFVYIRLLLKRSDYALDHLRETVNWFSTAIIIFLFMLHLIVLIKALYSIYWDYKVIHKPDPDFNKEPLNIPFMSKLNLIIKKIFTEPLEFIANWIAPKIPGFDHLLYLFRFYAHKYNLGTKGYWLVFIFYVLPRVIVATIFFVEIVFYHQMYYFIRSLIILIIPLIWIVFVELMTTRGYQFMNEIKQYYTIIPLGKAGPTGIHEDGYYLRGKEGYVYFQEALESAANIMSTAMDTIRLSVCCLTLYKMIAMPYTAAYCSSMYVLAFGYEILFIFL